MKSVLISIQPKWCELIVNGSKTIEARKSKPKLGVPFKCYIYETQGRTEIPWVDEDGHEIFKGRGQIIGEFVCDKLVWVVAHPAIFAGHDLFFEQAIKDAYLTTDEVEKYSSGKDVYGWHISNLKIYDKPKELSEFTRFCDGLSGKIGCRGCKYYYEESNESIGHYEGCGCEGSRPLKRPPQSWCYVESEVTEEWIS